MQSALDKLAEPPASAESRVPAVSRAVLLLERLARQRRPMSASLLAAELDLPRSSVHGLCNTLLHHGLLRRQGDGGFVIGSGVMHLAQAFVANTNVAQEFGEMWRDIGQSPDESIVLSVLDGTDSVYVAVRNSVRPLGLAFNVGMRLPAHLTGTGKAILAWLPPGTLAALLPLGPLERLTDHGPRSLAQLHAELAGIRECGYSVDDECVRRGVLSFGAPVFDASGAVVAGIGMCINKAQLARDGTDTHHEAVMRVAHTLSARLGAR
ncbi:MAG: IclR family transcriptional regulator [Burkholderiaceae bacterium]|jgi:DNA-binding IclR family transcriptional regulator